MSETAKQNKLSFESKFFLIYSSFFCILALTPSVSIKKIPSQFPNFSFLKRYNVPYAPLVHLP